MEGDKTWLCEAPPQYFAWSSRAHLNDLPAVKSVAVVISSTPISRDPAPLQMFVRRAGETQWILLEPEVPVLLSGITFTCLLPESGLDVSAGTIPAVSTWGLVPCGVSSDTGGVP